MWFKVDDKLHDHRKARAAGKSAMGVWLLAGSWSADNLTDGFVPTSVLSRWGTRHDAAKLVAVGLWHPDEQDGERGWRFHEWLERQPSRAEKLEERKMRAEVGRLGGLRSAQARREASAKQNSSKEPSNLLSKTQAKRVEPPSRPVPSRPSASKEADETHGDSPIGFDDFWDAYPRKVGKGQARKAWTSALTKTTANTLHNCAIDFAEWCDSEDKDEKWIPHPSTWLNGERWTDERTARRSESNIDKHLALVHELHEAEQNQPRQIGPA